MQFLSTSPSVLTAPADWRGADLQTTDWLYTLNASERDEVNAAVAHARASGKALLELGQADFPLPTLGPKLHEEVRLTETQLGFRLLRGVPVADKTEADARLVAWGLGLHMGVALPQNDRGDAILDVRDQGGDSKVTLRGNHSASEIQYHIDSSDIVTLLCRRRAKAGGLHRVVSSLAIHNEMARYYPDLLAEMYQPVPFKQLAGQAKREFFLCPVFGVRDGHFSSRYYRARILAAAKLDGAPALSDRQLAALDMIDAIASDPAFYLELDFEPGDFQIVSNHVIYHARTEFEDFDVPDQKRHLFRMWLATPTSRPLPDSFREAFGNHEPGTLRGGYQGWDFPEVGQYQSRMARELGVRIEAPAL